MIGKTSAGTSAKEEKTVTAGTAQKVVTPSNGKLLSKVTINPTPSQAKTATPSAAQQTIKPDSGKLLSQVLVNAVPDSEKKGLYAWKKFEYKAAIENVSFQFAYPGGYRKAQLTVTGMALSDVTTDMLVGLVICTNNTSTVKVVSPTQIRFYNSSNDYYYDFTFDNTTGVITATGNITFPQYTFPTTTVAIPEEKTFIDFVVSDNASAYPDGGTQGGYWYEKVVGGADLVQSFGYTKYAIDKFTLSSEIAVKYETCYINHSLGEKPSFAFLTSVGVKTDYRVTGGISKKLTGKTHSTKRGFYLSDSKELEESLYGLSILDATRVSYDSGNTTYMAKGVEYTLITMA